MKGRDALLNFNPKAALPNFEAIAQSNPNYINCAQGFCVGIWTYLGRTYHELGNNQKALESLNKGKGRYYSDSFNKIYLGLVMAQTGQIQEGKVELDAGLEALGDWLAAFAGKYWDPSGNLQKGIADTRTLLQGGLISACRETTPEKTENSPSDGLLPRLARRFTGLRRPSDGLSSLLHVAIAAAALQSLARCAKFAPKIAA